MKGAESGEIKVNKVIEVKAAKENEELRVRLHLTWRTRKGLLCSSGNSAQSSITALWLSGGRDAGGMLKGFGMDTGTLLYLTWRTNKDSSGNSAQCSVITLWLSGGRRGEGIVREFGMDMDTLLCLTWRTSKDLLDSTGNSARCHVAAWMGEEFGGESIYMYRRG